MVPKDNIEQDENWQKATWAFGGGINVHSRIAKRRMASLRVAKFEE